jgi:hypothetical protein
MKSIRIACTAITLTGIALGAVAAALSSPDRLLGESYERALASAPNTNPANLAGAAYAPGSEHFWLTSHAGEAQSIAPAAIGTDAVGIADIKKAVAATGGFDAARVEVIDVQEVPRATLHGQASGTRALLVTVSVGGEQGQRFVLDIASAPAAPAKTADAL